MIEYGDLGNDGMVEKKSFDNFFIGFFASVVLTLGLLCLLTRNALSSSQDFELIVRAIYSNPQFVNLMIASLFPSMFLFFFFYKTERWKSGKGLIVAVLLSMVLIVL